jgi:hypothetical protein
MSTSPCAADPGLADTQSDLQMSAAQGETDSPSAAPGASPLLRGLLIGFAASVTIGLGLTSWYVGVRIVSPNPSTQLYLEVAGTGPKRDPSFIRNLEAKGYRTRLQSVNPVDSRILIGPFARRGSLEEAQRELEAAGVFTVEAAH